MKLTILANAIALPMLLSGCLGSSSADNELTGQVKRAQHVTPIIYSDYDRIDVSLGIMQNGVGSMSKDDVWMYVPSPHDFAILKMAAETGQLVKIKYDVSRVRWYVENDMVTSVELVK